MTPADGGDLRLSTMASVLMTCSTLADGSGLMGAVGPLAKHLGDLGFSITLIGPTNRRGETTTEAEELGFCARAARDAAWLPRSVADAARAAASVSEFASGDGCRVVHVHGVWTPLNLAACARARSSGLPYVVSPHGMLMPLAMRRSGYRKRLAITAAVRRNLEAAALVHVSSHAEQASVDAVAPSAHTCLIPWGVNLSTTRRAKRLSDSRRRAAYVGRIIRLKGVDDLLSAWGMIRPSGWDLLFVGDDAEGHVPKLGEAIKAANLDESVSIHPAVTRDELQEQLRYIDLLILPSHSENFGMVVAEALAAGIPVIATTATPWAGLIDRKCGWWVPDSPAGLARAIAEAVELPAEALEAMGAQGRSWVGEAFGWSTIAARFIEELYQPCC